MKSFTVGWRGSSPQSLHDYNNGPAGTGTAGTADRVLATSLSEKDGIDTIKICDNPSYHYLHLHSIMYTLLHIFSNSIEILDTIDGRRYLHLNFLQSFILFPFANHPRSHVHGWKI